MKFMVAFSSPKRSAKTVEVASKHAKALDAEVVLLRLIPDPAKVGVVAQLIATDRPEQKAQEQINASVEKLKSQGINARGIVKIGEVARGIIDTAVEEKVDMLFVGTNDMPAAPVFFMERDPIVHYLVNRCPLPLALIRTERIAENDDSDS